MSAKEAKDSLAGGSGLGDMEIGLQEWNGEGLPDGASSLVRSGVRSLDSPNQWWTDSGEFDYSSAHS